jgi:hypothetical protein
MKVVLSPKPARGLTYYTTVSSLLGSLYIAVVHDCTVLLVQCILYILPWLLKLYELSLRYAAALAELL